MTRLERAIAFIMRTGAMASAVCLAAGLLLWFVLPGGPGALLLNAGVVLLLVTPVVRVLVSMIDYSAERNWPYVLLTAVVFLELGASVIAALVFNRRL